MKNVLLLLGSLLVLLAGCMKDQAVTGNNAPEMPDTERYDFNHDAEDDFSIEYQRYSWDGAGISGDGLAGRMVPLNDNLILINQKEKEYSLFNKIHDTIRKDVGYPLEWVGLDQDLVRVQNSSAYDYFWPSEWLVLSKSPVPDYYLGLIITDDVPLIGWVKLKINPSSGVIEITDKEFVQGEFIVINR